MLYWSAAMYLAIHHHNERKHNTPNSKPRKEWDSQPLNILQMVTFHRFLSSYCINDSHLPILLCPSGKVALLSLIQAENIGSLIAKHKFLLLVHGITDLSSMPKRFILCASLTEKNWTRMMQNPFSRYDSQNYPVVCFCTKRVGSQFASMYIRETEKTDVISSVGHTIDSKKLSRCTLLGCLHDCK